MAKKATVEACPSGKPAMLNFDGIGLREVCYSENGKRMRVHYLDDRELLVLVKQYKNLNIVVTDEYIFIERKG